MPLQDVKEISREMAGFVRDRHRRIRDIKGAGKKIVGYFCSYAPEELILAAGMHPVRIMADPWEQPGPVDAHLQNFACSFARACLDQIVRGRLDYLDGIVFPCTCDSLRAVSEIIRSDKKEDFFCHFLNMPLRVEGDPAREYYRRELEILYEKLARMAGGPAEGEPVKKAILLADANRELLKAIWESRRAPVPPLSGEDCLGIISAAVLMDREALRSDLGKMAGALVQNTDVPSGPGPVRLMLIGSVADNPRLINIIESSGAMVVADDLCTGSRYFTVPVNIKENEDPFDALARRYLGRVPCPAKYPVGRRIEHINGIMEDFDVQGAVVVLQKFCEPHAFDFPLIRDLASERGIPVINLETDSGHIAEGQVSTRIQALVEMIGGGR